MPVRRADLLRMRRLAHALDGEPEPTPVGVARRMLAVQAQDFAAGCLALAVRTASTTRAGVRAELDAGRIVRSWPMRGTLHFVPSEDLRWMLSLTAGRMLASLASRHRQLELEAPDFALARDTVTAALAGGEHIGRTELMALWEEAGIATTGQRGSHLIYYLAQTGVLCWGPTHGNQQALVLLDEWVPTPRTLEPDEAWAEYLLRYLRGHGPATIRDFVWWTKGTVAGAKTALAVLGDAVTTIEVEGVEHLVTTDLADRATGRPESRAERETVRLLPAFDEYLLGYRDRSPVLDDEHAATIVPGGNGVFQPVLIVRGRVAGTWRRGVDGPEVMPFHPLTAGQTASLGRAHTAYRRYAD